ncbi:MAG: DNA cytosine methyltransferase [Ascidiaceihabitans sp.]|nr:DNA cytosine methyltransferase [Ascidiaceihabitans sp.]
MVAPRSSTPTYAEFFCGGGMVHAALGHSWDCVLANDNDPMKCAVFRENWGGAGLFEQDIVNLPDVALQHPIDLFWASSPCQDFSLAGKGLGLAGSRSGVFQTWADKVRVAVDAGFAPRIIAFENVSGLVTRNRGADFKHVVKTLAAMGYVVGGLEIDARHFLPQSRPRIFVIAVRKDLDVSHLVSRTPDSGFHTTKLRRFVDETLKSGKRDWVWWKLPPAGSNRAPLSTLIDEKPDTKWLTKPEVNRLLKMMSPPSLERVAEAKSKGAPMIGTLYKRGRPDGKGAVHQRAEVRFDGIAGCLRTPAGGSSRQTLMFVDGDQIKARLLSRLEAIRLMGLPDDFIMPERYNQVYKVAGDGVAVPIVAHLDQHLFQAILLAKSKQAAA